MGRIDHPDGKNKWAGNPGDRAFCREPISYHMFLINQFRTPNWSFFSQWLKLFFSCLCLFSLAYLISQLLVSFFSGSHFVNISQLVMSFLNDWYTFSDAHLLFSCLFSFSVSHFVSNVISHLVISFFMYQMISQVPISFFSCSYHVSVVHSICLYRYLLARIFVPLLSSIVIFFCEITIF